MLSDTLYTDGGVSGNGTDHQRARICVHDGWEPVVDEEVGDKTNNEAEFLAIQRACELAEGQGPIEIISDSLMCVNILNGVWKARKPHLKRLSAAITLPDNVSLVWVPREQNLAGHHLEETYGT